MLASVTSIDRQRVAKRLDEYDNTIERFVRISTEASMSACDAEEAKQRYIGSISPDLIPPPAAA